MLLSLRVGHSRVDGLLEIQVEVRSVETLHGDETGVGCGRAPLTVSVDGLNVLLDGNLSSLLPNGNGGGSAVVATEVGNTEDGSPLASLGVTGSAESKASSSESPLGPAVLNVGKVPVDNLGRCVSVELVADIDKGLDRGNIDVVDSRKVKDDSLEKRTVVGGGLRNVTGLAIVPGAVLEKLVMYRQL